MRCKRHTVDSTSSIGVCASCLRERLFPLTASTAAIEDNDHLSPPSVLASSDSRFLDSAGGVGSSSSSEKVFETNRSFQKKQTGLSRFFTFFRTRSNDYSRDVSTFSPSSSWFSSKKQATCYIEDLIASESNHQQQRHRYCKGMSPANGLESVEDSPGRARRTPATGNPGRRKTATMALCLSPLVIAKPSNCSFAYTGEMKSPVKPSFCSKRSRKLADLGRADHRR